MTTYALHFARSTGLADALHPAEEEVWMHSCFAPVRRIRIPRAGQLLRPRGPAPGRALRPGARRPGRAGGFGSGAGQAMLLAVAAAAVEKLWKWRWYFASGFGCYVLVRCVRYVWQRVRANSTQPRVYRQGEEILSAYLLETLKKEKHSDIDVCSVTSSFTSYPNTGLSAAFYCTEHLHLKVLSHFDLHTPLMGAVKVFLDRMMSVITSANDSDAVNEMSDGVSFCELSQGGQGVGLYINRQLGAGDIWDCCSQDMHGPVFVQRSFDNMSYMVAKRLSSNGTLLENMPGDPEFIIFLCDGLCNLLQNMQILQFAYQGVRNGMPMRPLCETLLDIIKASNIKTAAVLMQFKIGHQ